MANIKKTITVYTACDEVTGTLDESTINNPYLEYTAKIKAYNPNYPENKKCICGHSYGRHFDSYEDMAPVGCKYCSCNEFVPAEEAPLTELSVRAYNCLRVNKIETVEQLLETPDEKIRGLRNIGQRAADEVIAFKNLVKENKG